MMLKICFIYFISRNTSFISCFSKLYIFSMFTISARFALFLKPVCSKCISSINLSQASKNIFIISLIILYYISIYIRIYHPEMEFYSKKFLNQWLFNNSLAFCSKINLFFYHYIHCNQPFKCTWYVQVVTNLIIYCINLFLFFFRFWKTFNGWWLFVRGMVKHE